MDGECCICLDSLFEKEDPKQKPKLATMAGCGHIFHEGCLRQCFKQLEVPLSMPYARKYKSHPACPKCRALARPCQDGACRSHYYDRFADGFDGHSYACTPYVSLFLNDTDTGGLFKPKETDVGILMVKNKAGGQERYNLADTVRTLGLDIQKVQEEVSVMLQIDLEDGQPLLGKQHVTKMNNIKSKVENLLSSMKYKSTDATLKAVATNLAKAIDDLGKELTSDEIIRTLRERIDDFDMEMDTAVEEALDDMRGDYDDEIGALQSERLELEERLAQKTTECRQVAETSKRQGKTVAEQEKDIKKLTAKQKKLESEIEAAQKEKLKKRQELADLLKKYTELQSTHADLKSVNSELKRQAKGFKKQQSAAEALAANAQAFAVTIGGNKTPSKSKGNHTVIDLSKSDTPQRAAKRPKIERELTPVPSEVSSAPSTPIKLNPPASGRGDSRPREKALEQLKLRKGRLGMVNMDTDSNRGSSERSGRLSRITRSTAAKRKRDVGDDDDYDPESEI